MCKKKKPELHFIEHFNHFRLMNMYVLCTLLEQKTANGLLLLVNILSETKNPNLSWTLNIDTHNISVTLKYHQNLGKEYIKLSNYDVLLGS